MIRETVHALVACVVTFVLCAVAYPAVVWGLGQLVFPHQAEGSLIYARDRKVIGSELIAQPFASDAYFHPRPSAADYKADAASGSNLGTKNPDLRAKIAERAAALKATSENPAPADLVTASGCGLDPHISIEAALYQAARVAASRKLPIGQVRDLIARFTERSGEFIGAPPRVNVLMLNRALDEEKPAPKSDGVAAEGPVSVPGASPSPTQDEAGPARQGTAIEVAAIRTQIEGLNDHLDRLGKQIEGTREGDAGAGLKDLERRVAALSENTAKAAELSQQVARIDERVRSAGETLQQIRSEIEQMRGSLKPRATTKPEAGRRQ